MTTPVRTPQPNPYAGSRPAPPAEGPDLLSPRTLAERFVSMDAGVATTLDIRLRRRPMLVRWAIIAVVVGVVVTLPPVLVVAFRPEPAAYNDTLMLAGLLVFLAIVVLVPLVAFAVSHLVPAVRQRFAAPVLRIGSEGLTVRRHPVPAPTPEPEPPAAEPADATAANAEPDEPDDDPWSASDLVGADPERPEPATDDADTTPDAPDDGENDEPTDAAYDVELPAETFIPRVVEVAPAEEPATPEEPDRQATAEEADPHEVQVSWSEITGVRVMRGWGKRRLGIAVADLDTALAELGGDQRRSARWNAKIYGTAHVVDLTYADQSLPRVLDTIRVCSRLRPAPPSTASVWPAKQEG